MTGLFTAGAPARRIDPGGTTSARFAGGGGGMWSYPKDWNRSVRSCFASHASNFPSFSAHLTWPCSTARFISATASRISCLVGSTVPNVFWPSSRRIVLTVSARGFLIAPPPACGAAGGAPKGPEDPGATVECEKLECPAETPALPPTLASPVTRTGSESSLSLSLSYPSTMRSLSVITPRTPAHPAPRAWI